MTDNFNIPSFCCIFVSRLDQDSYNVHRNKKFSVFHICLFSERYDFCDFDIGCSSVSTNFVKHRTRFYCNYSEETKHPCINKGVGHGIFNLALGVDLSFLSRREGLGHLSFIKHISKCSPLPPNFLTSVKHILV